VGKMMEMVNWWSNGGQTVENGQAMAKQWSNRGTTIVKQWPLIDTNNGQTVVKRWLYTVKTVKCWSNGGQKMVQRWSNDGHMVIKIMEMVKWWPTLVKMV
jgi:hypothetical protein